MSPTKPPPGRRSDPPPKGTPPPMMPPRRTWLWFLAILVANFFLVRLLSPGPEGPVTVPYTLFKEQVSQGNVESIYSQGDSMTGRFKKPVTYPPAGDKDAATKAEPAPKGERKPPAPPSKPVTSFSTTVPSFVDPGLEGFLIEHGVEISAKPTDEGGSPWVTLLFGFGPALLIIGFYVWMFRRAQQGGGGFGNLMGIGKSK
ncbi:MAG TPA: ATP-dependent metallopeptidase FtsH/Yme1/Tma family protein, partial [Methylomirabilota bacterium]